MKVEESAGDLLVRQVSPLLREAVISLRWEVVDPPAGERIVSQTLALDLGHSNRVTLQFGGKEQEASFPLPLGTAIDRPKIVFSIDFSGGKPPFTYSYDVKYLTAVLPDPVSRNPPATNFPDIESLKAVYSEQQQETQSAE